MAELSFLDGSFLFIVYSQISNISISSVGAAPVSTAPITS